MSDTPMPASHVPTSSPRERLIADLMLVIADAEELLKMTAGQAGEKAVEVRHRVEQRLATARAELARVQAEAAAHVRQAGQAADHYVHQHPWTAVGVAAGAGLVLGLLLSRR